MLLDFEYLEVGYKALQGWEFEFAVFIFETKFKQSVEVVIVVFEVIGSKSKETLQNVEARKYRIDVGVFK